MPAKIPKPSLPQSTVPINSVFLTPQKRLTEQFSPKIDQSSSISSAMATASKNKTSKEVTSYLKSYLLAVAKTGCSASTVRNYKSDINQFLDFLGSKDLNDLRNKPKLLAFAHYQREKGLKETSIKRKLISITQFKMWLKQQGLIVSEIPLPKIEVKETQKPASITPNKDEAGTATAGAKAITKSKANKKTGSRIFLILNLLALILFLAGLAYFAYQQFGQALISLAYPSTPNAPNRVLSYQGRLTNLGQSPISEPTAMTYALYDDVTGGNLLWSSGICNIDPDQDGIFNANLGAGSGAGSDNENCGGTIGEDVFTAHSNVWLEVVVGSETLSPRQPIRTVAYALNAATLQGLPVATIASNSTILMMNDLGEIVLGTDNPVIKTATSSSGMTIEANQITIQTSAGSNGDIILAPDGDGLIQLQGNTSMTGDNTLSGNLYLNSPNNLIFGGSTALGEISSATDSGAFLIGAFDEFSNSNSTNVQGVLNDLDAAIVSAGTPSWSNLAAPSNNLSLSHGTYLTAFNWATGTGTNNLFSLTTDASSNGTGSLLNLQTGTSSTISPLKVRAGSTEALFVDNSGKVGIGTASPTAKLHVVGSSDTQQLIVKGYSSQTANLTEWQNSSGTNLANISAAGVASFADYKLLSSSPTSVVTLGSDGTSLLPFMTGSYADQFAFKPVVSLEYDTDGSGSWTADTASAGQVLFDGNQNTKLSVNPASYKGFRVVVDAGNYIAPIIAVVEQSWTSPGGTSPLNILFESSADGSSWTTRKTFSTTANISSSVNHYIELTNHVPERYWRISVVRTDAGTNNLNIYDIKLLASTNMNFGALKGLPFTWDYDRLISGSTLANGSIGIQGTTNSTRTTSYVNLQPNGGNVGIGTTSPTATLHVNGSLRLSGALYDGANAPGTSGQVLTSTGTGTTWTSLSGLSVGNADTLDSLDSLQFLRSDTSDSFTSGTLSLASGTTLDVNLGATLDINGSLTANGGALFQNTSNSTTALQVNNAAGASILNVDTTNGRVGIGTTAPGYALEVAGDTGLKITGTDWGSIPNPGSQLNSHALITARGFSFSTDNTTLSSAYQPSLGIGIAMNRVHPAMSIRNDMGPSLLIESGNVGIGTSSPGEKLDVNGNLKISATTGDLILQEGEIETEEYFDMVSQRSVASPTQGLRFFAGSGKNKYFEVSVPSGDVWMAGNVGIGVTSPSYKLDVSGDINLTGALRATGNAGTSGQVLTSTGAGLSWTNASSVGTNYWQRNSGALSPLSISDSLNLGATATASALVHLAGTAGENSFINTGNLGIGTTSPSNALTVNGAISASSLVSTPIVRNGAGTLNFQIWNGAWIDAMYIGSSGNVGIGTTSPDRKLKVVTSGDTAPGFSVDGSSLTNNEVFELLGTIPTNSSTGRAFTVGSAAEDYSRGVFYNDGTLGIGPGSSTRDVFLRRSAANTMMIDSNMSGGAANFLVTGKIGIGVTSPAASLALAANTSSRAQLNLAPSAGVNLSAPSSGDVWWNGTNLNFYNGSSTIDLLDSGAADSLWVDGSTYLYTLSNKVLGNPTSGGTNKISGLYLADNGPLYFGTDNDTNFNFSGSTLATTLGTNAWNIGSNLLYLSASNNRIGLGTATPLATLDVRALNPDVAIASFSGNTNLASLMIDQNGTGDLFTASAAAQTKFVITNTGSVGIGTNLPARKMEIVDGSNPQLRLTQTGASIYSDFQMNSNGDLIINVDNVSDQLVLDNGGNVGVGLNNPDEKLTVAGSVKAEKFYDHSNKNYFLDLAAEDLGLKIAGDADIGGSADIGGDATVSGNINVGNNLIFNPIASSNSSALGTVYYDSDDDALYLYNGALQRIAVDMTRYSADGVIANANYLEINHGQNTNDLSIIAWVKDKISGLWRTTESVSTTVKQSLENEFNEASASGIIRTRPKATGVQLNPPIDVGTGADGDVTISGTVLLDSTVPSPSGRSCADAANFAVTALTATSATVASYSAGCLSVGDEVLLINVQGISTAYGNTGNYETLRVASINSSTIGFTTTKTKYYGDGATDDTNIGTGATNQHVVLQRVPNYRQVIVSSGANLTVNAWDNTTYKGGILFFRASQNVSVGGTIHANAKGYLGGTNPVKGNNSTNYGGESYCSATGGGAGGNGDQTQAATNGVCGGGGGASYNPTTVGTGSNNGGAGGAGGNRDGDSTTVYFGGGGAGAGYGTEGGFGYSGVSTSGNGQAASGTQNGNGGSYVSGGSGGGGGAGGTYGDAGLNKLYFGSGGGAGGTGRSSTPADINGGAGGAGGGIVMVAANTFTVSGAVQSSGGVGIDADTGVTAGGKGGGGAGGSIKILANSAALGSSLVTAAGGLGATDSGMNDGGDGGAGRIAVYYYGSAISGTTSPAANSQAMGNINYGLYHSPVISTPNATSYGLLTFDSAPTPYGKVQLQTRSGSSTNPTDGTWETWKPFTVATNYLSLQNADTHANWVGGATVAEGDVTRDVDYFEDEDESNANNLTKITSSVNGDYAQATISSTDISTYDYVTFWVRASQTGTVLRIGMGETAPTEQTEDIVIDVANQWQKVYWDLSDIAAADRNAIITLRLTNLSSASNTIYIDNFRAEKLISTSGNKINSTPNNYFQYRVVFTTTNPSYQPAIDNISFTYQNGYKIEQTDANNVRIHNYTGEEQELRLEAIVFGADLAEWYTVNDASIGPGDVVAITGEMDEYGVPILRKSEVSNDPMLLGVISTQAGTTLGIKAENRRLLALDGRVPVKIAPDSEAIKKGDHLTAANQAGMARKAKTGELSIGRSFENWTPGSENDRVLAIVNDVMATPSFTQQLLANLTELSELINYKIQDGWQVINNSTGEVLNSALVLAEAVIGKLRVGQLEVAEIKAPDNKALQIVTQDVALQLNAQQDSSSSSTLGKLMIQNQDQETVISFDSEGNASFSGELAVGGELTVGEELTVTGTSRLGELIAKDASIAGNLVAENFEANSARMDYLESKLANLENATVSGTLYAESIEANSIKANVISGLEERLSDKINETLNQPSLLAALFTDNQIKTEEYIQQLQAEFNPPEQASASSLSELTSNNDNLDLIADTAFINQYFEVNGNAMISNSLKLGQSLMLGEDTVIGNGFINYQPQLAEGDDFTFSIQPTGRGKLSLMAGLMQLDGQGFVSINGDLRVAGVLEVEDKLKVKDTLLTNLIAAENPDESIKVQLASLEQDPDSEKTVLKTNNFEFINEQAAPVASFSAAGDLALTGSLRLGPSPAEATQAGQSANGRSAGQAILQAGQTEVNIATDKVEENSMIYITPMNSTNNQVLYVKNKIADSTFTKENEAQFTVGIDYPLDHNVIFNWWIIQLN